jgi:hypothetical protein
MLKSCLFILGFTFITTILRAQSNAVDSPSMPVIANAGNIYNSFIAKQSRLYNGIEHLGYSHKMIGYAYFQKPELQKGSLVYDDLEFTDVPMLYDMFKDQVIIQHFNRATLIGLVREKVSSFSLQGHHFIRIDSLEVPSLKTGFYDEMYKGRINVLVKRVRIIEETIKDELERTFIAKDLYYIQKGDVYYNVKNYKGLLAFFGDNARQVKQYLRKNRIRFNKDRENAIIKATAYYDSLTR